VWWLGSQVVAGLNLNFFPGTISAMDMVGANPVISFTIQAQNTSGTALTINSLSGNISQGSTLIGNVYNFTPVTLPPQSNTAILVTAQLSALTITNDIVQAFQNGLAPTTITVQCVANVNGVQVPINLTYTVG
jgi:LEA14-like dessication related protein